MCIYVETLSFTGMKMHSVNRNTIALHHKLLMEEQVCIFATMGLVLISFAPVSPVPSQLRFQQTSADLYILGLCYRCSYSRLFKAWMKDCYCDD